MAGSLRCGMTVEIAPFYDGNSAPECGEFDGSVGVVKIFKGNSQGLSAVVAVKTGPRAGKEPLVPAACLLPLVEK